MDKKLPVTSYIVLGLLSLDKECSGYQIRKASENLAYFYWSPAQSQIYRELRNLEANQLVTSRYVKQQGKPDKRLFRLTAEGTAVLRDWLAEKELPPTVRKHPLLLKLFFGHIVEPEVIQRLLQKFIEDMQENLAQLAIVEAFTSENAESEYAAMIVEWNIHYCQAELVMAQKFLTRLQDEA